MFNWHRLFRGVGALGVVVSLIAALTALVPTAASAAVPAALTISKTSLAYGKQRVATHGKSQTVTITNATGADVTLGNLLVQGADQFSFYGSTNCFPHGRPRVLAAGATCRATLLFAPLKYGARHAVLRVLSSAPGSPQSIRLSGTGTEGYFLAGARGEVGTFGDAVYHGDATRLSLSSPIISLATTPNGAGYWLLGRDGGIFTYGNAKFHGSTGARHLNQPIVAMYPTPSGKGYWLVASDGGIFTFGSARYHGSTAELDLGAPIVAMASTRDGKGYWLVSAKGAVYPFGNARKYGAASGVSAPVVQIAPTPTGHGYWLVTADGHLYAYGDAPDHGSAAGKSIVGIAPTSDGRGYWEVSRSGAIYSFGNAHGHGRLGAGVNDVIGIAATAPPIPAVLLKFATRASGTSNAGSASATIAHAGGDDSAATARVRQVRRDVAERGVDR